VAEVDADFEALLQYLRAARGFDFTGYKRTVLVRRVRKRMHEVGVDAFGDYTDYLQVHSGEFAALFDTILINVTSFFRDPEAWDFLAGTVIPRIADQKRDGAAIRAWCAGTASGEEAYSLAMLLAEALGVDDFRERVKIYGTDVDEGALGHGRPGGHSVRDMDGVTPELRDKYFEQTGSHYVFRSDLRRSLIFGRHDLVQDAPISRLDLLVCRNTLMYFTAETQARVLARLHFALNDDGFLFLGRAEMLLTHAELFTPLDLSQRVFVKVPKPNVRERLLVLAQAGNVEATGQLGRQVKLLELIADTAPGAQLVVDAAGSVVTVNEAARQWFRLNHRDVGRPLQDLEVSYRPVDLRSLIDAAFETRSPARQENVERALADGEVQYLDVHVAPLLDYGNGVLGASIFFIDVTAFNRLQKELEQSGQALETAYEELQATNEELETTNEELQSTVEELETTNEELQSSNEELETMNEELESTNAELMAINAELRRSSDEVEEASRFLESVLTSLQLGVMVLDGNLRVKMWDGRSEDFWGLRAAEVYDQPLPSLDIGLPMPEMRRLVRSALQDPAVKEAVVDATNRRGHKVRSRILAKSMTLAGAQPGVLLLMEERREDGPPVSPAPA